MPRLIDADALRDTIDRYLHAPHVQVGNSIGQGMRIAIKSCIELLDNERTIDPESLRPHGRWEESESGFLVCSECADVFILEEWLADGKWNYCPNCGAKMDKEEDK